MFRYLVLYIVTVNGLVVGDANFELKTPVKIDKDLTGLREFVENHFQTLVSEGKVKVNPDAYAHLTGLMPLD